MDNGNNRLWIWYETRTRKKGTWSIRPTYGNIPYQNYRDNTEQLINHISHKETLNRKKTETKKDNILRKLTSHVINNDWVKAEKDQEMASYKHIKEEISIIEGMVQRERENNYPKFATKENSKNRTPGKNKQLLRGRYWFPKINNMIDRIINQYYECKGVSSDPRPEPIKLTVIPKRSRDIVSFDFGGPYPDGH